MTLTHDQTEGKHSFNDLSTARDTNVTREQILAKLSAAMCEMFELAPSAITLDAELRSDLGLDSIDAVDMAVNLQKMTGKKVQLAELMSIRTVSDVVDVIERHIAPQAQDSAN